MNWASCYSLNFLEKRLRASQVTIGRRWVVWPSYFLGVENFFKLFVPFAVIYYYSHHSSSGCLFFSFSLSWALMWPRGCGNNILVEFSENSFRENTAFLEDFCFRIHCSLHNTQLSFFGTSLLWDSIRWAAARFCWLFRCQNVLSQLNFVWS